MHEQEDDAAVVCTACKGVDGHHYRGCPEYSDVVLTNTHCQCISRFVGRHEPECQYYEEPFDDSKGRPQPEDRAMSSSSLQPTVTDRQVLDSIGKMAHEINRAYCQAIGESEFGPWDECPEHVREAVRDGVRFHIRNPVTTPESSHNNWMQKKFQQGWRLAPVKDVTKKYSPNLVAFEKLPLEQQVKDYLFRACVRVMIDG